MLPQKYKKPNGSIIGLVSIGTYAVKELWISVHLNTFFLIFMEITWGLLHIKQGALQFSQVTTIFVIYIWIKTGWVGDVDLTCPTFSDYMTKNV